MNDFLPNDFINLLMISMILSVIVMTFIQKLKSFSFITKTWQIGFWTLIFSFIFGIPFAFTFYALPFMQGMWISLFSFIGAPTLYDALKNQTIVNFKPSGLSDKLSSDASENLSLKETSSPSSDALEPVVKN